MNIVKHFNNTSVSAVSAITPAAALPSGLVISPGHYTFNGEDFDCSTEGLYRFWTPMGQTLNRIVYNSDVNALMSGLSWLCVNGRADEALTVSAKTDQAATSKLRMLCGKTIEWVTAILDSLSIPNRTVRCLTGDTPTNYYDGHVMIEVEVGGQWKLFDVANGLTYQETGTGEMLKDVLPLVSSTTVTPIDGDGYSVEPWATGEFDVTAWIENTMLTETDRRAELERVLQIPGIDHTDGNTYFYLPAGMESRSSYVTGLSATYVVVDQATWLGMFYP